LINFVRLIVPISILLILSSVFAMFSPLTLPASLHITYYRPQSFVSETGSYWLNFTFVSALGENYTTIDLRFYPMGNEERPTIVPIMRSNLLSRVGSPVFYYTNFYNMSCVYLSYLYSDGRYSYYPYQNSTFKECGTGSLLLSVAHPPNTRYQVSEGFGIPVFLDGGYWATSTYDGNPPTNVTAWSWYFRVSDLVIVYRNGYNISLRDVGFVVNMTTERAQSGWRLIPDVGISGASFDAKNTTTGAMFIVHTNIVLALYTFRYAAISIAALCGLILLVSVFTELRKR